jgi:ribonuclease P protein component
MSWIAMSWTAMERLKRRTDFRAAATGVRAPGKGFVLQALQRPAEGAVRVGFTVSKQVGNAVERNRVRRRLREIVRLTAEGEMRPGHDYVLIGRRAALALPFGEMRRELDAALSRIHAPQSHSPDGGGREATGRAGGRRLHEAGSPQPTPRRKPRQNPRQNPGNG